MYTVLLGDSDSTGPGALIGVALLAVILLVCVGCLTITVIVLLKGRLKVPKRAQQSMSSGPGPPSKSQTDPEVNENAAYGLPSSMKQSAEVDTKENAAYGLPSTMKSTKRVQENLSYENT